MKWLYESAFVVIVVLQAVIRGSLENMWPLVLVFIKHQKAHLSSLCSTLITFLLLLLLLLVHLLLLLSTTPIPSLASMIM